MELIKLTYEEIDLTIRALRKGYYFNNGLAGNLSFYYQEGIFIASMQYTQDPDEEPIKKHYNQEAFERYLAHHSFVDFVYDSLMEGLEKYKH